MNGRQRQRRRSQAAGLEIITPAEAAAELAADAELEQVPLVEEHEVRWMGYDTAMEEATAHRDRMLDSAAARLDSTMTAAYRDYGKAVDAADAAFAAARRAAMNAHELAQATP